MIRVLIASSRPIVREGLSSMLSGSTGIGIVGHASEGVEAIRLFAAHRPDIAVLDLCLTNPDGMTVIHALRESAPGARLIAFATESTDRDALGALRAGAAGYLGKDTHRGELIACILRVHAGRPHFAASIGSALIEAARHDAMTRRERQIIELLGVAYSNRQIAAALGIAASTVKSHVGRILKKLGAKSRIEALRFAERRGLIRSNRS